MADDAGNGALFKNDRKEKDTHPDYKGDCTINGTKFWVSAWIKTSQKNGKKFMSLAFRRAEEDQPAASTNNSQKRPASRAGGRGFDRPLDDETIPF